MTGVVLIPKPVDALPKTNRAPERENFIFQASIFSCQLAVGFREGDSPPSQSNKKTSTLILLMEEIRLTTWDVSNPLDDGINYQPQLVDAEFLPSTVSLDHDWSNPNVHPKSLELNRTATTPQPEGPPPGSFCVYILSRESL